MLQLLLWASQSSTIIWCSGSQTVTRRHPAIGPTRSHSGRSSHWRTLSDIASIVQHAGEDILGVLESFSHFCVVAIECQTQRHYRPLTLLVDVSDKPALRVEQYLGSILKIDLHNFIAQSEHRRVTCAHPLFNVHTAWHDFDLLEVFRLRAALDFVLIQIRLEMIQQSYFLLQWIWELI